MSSEHNAEVGYSIYEDTRTFDKASDYLHGLSYPCIILETNDEKPIPTSRLTALKGMLDGADAEANPVTTPVILYFKTTKMMQIGKLQGRQIKSFLKLFEGSLVVGYLDSNTKLESDYLFVLSS